MLQGFRRCFQNADEFQALVAVSQRRCPVLDAIQKMLALGFERLFLFDIGSVDIAVMVGVLKLSERVVMGRTLDARVEDPDFFKRRKVVINNHALAADNRHFAHFSRIQPAAVNDGGPFSGIA